MSRRELIAKDLMAAAMVKRSIDFRPDLLAKHAVQCADALIKELDRKKKK